MKLTPSQESALDYSQNILVEAGAGSGKTGLFVHRYCKILEENPNISPSQIVALTFTKKAASECLTRIYNTFTQKNTPEAQKTLQSLQHAHITTIHGFCATLIKEFALACNLPQSQIILSEPERDFLIKTAIKTQLNTCYNKKHPSLKYILTQHSESRLTNDLIQCFQKEDLLDQFTEHTRKTLSTLSQHLHTLYSLTKIAYTTLKKTNQAQDYNDLVRQACEILKNPLIQKHCQSQFKYIMIDECQDTDPLQWELLSLLCHSTNPLSEKKLFLVGDTKQCIYQFRGANLDFFTTLQTQFNSHPKTATIIHLAENFRTCHHIIDKINPIFAHLFAQKSSTHPTYTPLIPTQNNNGSISSIFLKDTQNEADEFQAIAHQLHTLLDQNTPEKDICILTRERRYGEKLTQYLKEKKLPVHTDKQKGFFEQQSIIDLINIIRTLSHPTDMLSCIGLLQSPLFSLSLNQCHALITGDGHCIFDKLQAQKNPEFQHINNTLQAWYTHAQTAPFSQVISHIFKDESHNKALFPTPQSQRLYDHFLEHLLSCESSPNYKRHALLEELEFKCQQHNNTFDATQETQNSITLTTIHSAKGLEFPVVILAGCHRKFPLKTSNTCLISPFFLHCSEQNETATDIRKEALDKERHQSYDEEKRLFYVACTRAKKNLILTGLYTAKKTATTASYLGFLKSLPNATTTPTQFRFTTPSKEIINIPCTFQIPEETPVTQNNRPQTHIPYRHTLKLPTAPSLTDVSPATDTPLKKEHSISVKSTQHALLGTLIHEYLILSLTQKTPRYSTKKSLEESPLYQQLPDTLKKDAHLTLKNTLNAPFIHTLKHKPLITEYPFSSTYKNTHINGRIDLLLLEKDQLHIIEIKTDQLPNMELLSNRHSPQLITYAHCLNPLFPTIKKLTLSLFSTHLNQVTHIPFPQNPPYDN